MPNNSYNPYGAGQSGVTTFAKVSPHSTDQVGVPVAAVDLPCLIHLPTKMQFRKTPIKYTFTDGTMYKSITHLPMAQCINQSYIYRYLKEQDQIQSVRKE